MVLAASENGSAQTRQYIISSNAIERAKRVFLSGDLRPQHCPLYLKSPISIMIIIL
jgi:hypothetical protein